MKDRNIKEIIEDLKDKFNENFYTNICLIILTVILIAAFIYVFFMIKHRLAKRYECTRDLPKNCIGLKLKGIVIKVGDGDGFRMHHQPMFNKDKIPKNNKTLSIRLAGIDAPEVRTFKRPEQKFAIESRDFLRTLILNKTVEIEVLKIDRYNRIVATVFVKNKNRKKINVSIEMVKAGLACVFEGGCAVYGNYEKELRKTQEIAKAQKIEIWSDPDFILPMDYKRMYAA
ncbi:hypothetical protein EDEG_02432 [Edhazardia aedis USNM 41457]|uniref:TNase-like domain-containing protein n=1 Tax=Edhazardia aedis (strain USNM 41457) TaxID=1003232 RepID=J9D6N6_EDHAE|nr:hypothetical protein EDEG_02432 [Edhazardia aedis USNM 41457]|eukprot:EJW03179.1 hypothetical protein EDEG_02432 [Edhazardia aedis USNM 41457]